MSDHDSATLDSSPAENNLPPARGFWTEDLLAILIGWTILLVSLSSVRFVTSLSPVALNATSTSETTSNHLLSDYAGKPGTWYSNPLNAFRTETDSIESTSPDGTTVYTPSFEPELSRLPGAIGAGVIIGVIFTLVLGITRGRVASFVVGFPVVFGLGMLAYLLAGQAVIKGYNLEYALWALAIGLIIANTVGTPKWLKNAARTEFYIKTGLVLLGSEILMSRLLALGMPGVCVAWIVTPIVLITTFWFGQKVLKIQSPTLNMVISADMSVCGVSAAIASAAACKAKKEELSFAIGLSLSFTVLMMILMPAFIAAVGMDEVLAGAWMGGTIDATGAVAAAGELVGDKALEVAATIKMIQNILIGVVAFGIAVFWTTFMDRDAEKNVGWSEIWLRFPKFIIGFIVASIAFSILHGSVSDGDLWTSESIKFTKSLRGWLFCLAFVSIGLETNFAELKRFLHGGKPVLLYLCGQTLNLTLTFAMAYLMFKIVFPQAADLQ